MSYRVEHQTLGSNAWYLLERWQESHREKAILRARKYATDHGGQTRVLDHEGNSVFDNMAARQAFIGRTFVRTD